MSFQSIAGQEQAKRLLQTALRERRLSHAYLFAGPKGSGRRQLARKLAQAIYCSEHLDDACGECLNCRKVEHGNHPDVQWIEPEGASIKIEQIRELQKEFAYRSAGSETKIYVIGEADRMTVQAANSLLKFLEEPGSDIVAVLLTDNAQAILPTIRSRAQLIPFVPMNADEMERALIEEGLPQTLVRPAVHLAAGLDAARALAGEAWFAEARSAVIQLAKETVTRFPGAMLTAQQKVWKTDIAERVSVLLDLWMLWLKDMLQVRYGRKDRVVYIDQVEWMSTYAMDREAEDWVCGMERIVELQKRLRMNANPQLAVEKLMIDLQGGLACTP